MASTDVSEKAVESQNNSVKWHKLSIFLMVASSVLISFSGVAVRNIETTDVWQISFYRSLAFSFVIGLLVYKAEGDLVTKFRRIGWSGLLGGAIVALAGFTYVLALNNTTVANTLFILSAIPFITAALAWVVLREHIQTSMLVAMIVASGGMYLMLADGFAVGSTFGNSMAIVTALCFAAFAVIARRNRSVDMLPALFVAGVLLVVAAVIMRPGNLAISAKDILLCLVWGAGLTGVANWFFIIASRYLVAAELTLFMLLEFALGPIWVWLFVGEVPTYLTILGGTVVISSVAARALYELSRSASRNGSRRLPGPP